MTETLLKIENGKLVVCLQRAEYDYIESIAKKEFKDARCYNGVLKTYAIIKGLSQLNPSMTSVPIDRDYFRLGVSAKNYAKYQHVLQQYGIITVKKEARGSYTDVSGKPHIICTSTKRYSVNLLSCHFAKGLFFDQGTELVPIRISISSKTITSLRMKIKAITEGKTNGMQADKIDNLMGISDNEAYVMTLVIQLIKDVYTNKLKSQSRFDRRIREIAKLYKTKETLRTREYIISVLVYKVLISLYQIKKKENEVKRIEHIVGNYLNKTIDNQIYRWSEERRNVNNKLSYYQNLSVDYEALDYCVQMRDLYHIAHISDIPKYTYPSKKLYSKLASLRKSIRKYVRFEDYQIVEVSDIHSAHFTMLPVIFKKSGIGIPEDEMKKFKRLTQTGDLYAAVAANSSFSRTDIKSVFQPFFSIKNERSFLFNREELDRQKRQLICNYFSQNYPAIYSALIHYHCSHSKTIKSVANEVESCIMNPICDELRASGLHPFRIHDAIYLPINEVCFLNIDIRNKVIDIINNMSQQDSIMAGRASSYC